MKQRAMSRDGENQIMIREKKIIRGVDRQTYCSCTSTSVLVSLDKFPIAFLRKSMPYNDIFTFCGSENCCLIPPALRVADALEYVGSRSTTTIPRPSLLRCRARWYAVEQPMGPPPIMSVVVRSGNDETDLASRRLCRKDLSLCPQAIRLLETGEDLSEALRRLHAFISVVLIVVLMAPSHDVRSRVVRCVAVALLPFASQYGQWNRGR